MSAELDQRCAGFCIVGMILSGLACIFIFVGFTIPGIQERTVRETTIDIQIEAVKRNVGEWQVTDKGVVFFQWKECFNSKSLRIETGKNL